MKRYFDIANHFVEWAGQECNWSLSPSSLQKLNFLSAYFLQITGRRPTTEEVCIINFLHFHIDVGG
jgi:hypothetical protein